MARRAPEFKAKCLALMDQVVRTGEPILVTKNGKPVAELRPHRPRRPTLRGAWKGLVEIRGDVIAPLDEEWDALR